jgi:REP element-mobilizing transposase RayT
MKNAHSITDCNYHFVFVTKYRKNGNFDDFCEIVFNACCHEQHAEIIELSFNFNHIHLLCQLPSTLSVADFSCRVKSNFSRIIANDRGNWPGFQNGYYCNTVGNGSLQTVKNYIRNN